MLKTLEKKLKEPEIMLNKQSISVFLDTVKIGDFR